MAYINEKILTSFVVDYTPPDEVFIADKILTNVPVSEISGKYTIWEKKEKKITNDVVGYRASTPEIPLQRIPKKGTYATERHGLRDFISEEDAKTYKEYMDPVKEKAFGLKTQLMRNREKLVASTVASSTNVPSDSITKWDTDGATIQKDISDAIQEFRKNSGVLPNTMIIPWEVWEAIKLNEDLVESWGKIVKAQASPQVFTLASYFNLVFESIKTILIPTCQYDTTGKGITEVSAPIWGDNVAFLYTTPKGTKNTFTWVARFVKQELTTEVFPHYDKDIPGDWVKVYYEDDLQVVSDSCLYVIKDVLTGKKKN
ncbi:MAG TPA: hypothetical protein PKV21_08530 [bacterium]|nr:hypothetical protein [bacterium]